MPPIVIVLAVFIGLFVLRVPVAFALGLTALVGLWLSPLPISLSTLATSMWQGVNSFILLAIPFFVLMGNLAMASGVTVRLVKFAAAFVGHISGGLAHVSVVVNMIMAGMSGSDLADAAATGSILIPAMRRAGYPPGYAAAIIAGAATIGPLIPPSIGLLIYGAVTDTSIGRLFLGGAVPGVVLGLFLMLQAYVVARRDHYPCEPPLSATERLEATKASLPVLVIPIIVLGSILGGFATPTEAAMVGVAAVTVVGGLIYRELSLTDFAEQTMAALKTTASIFFIIATAAAFARVLTLYGAATALATWVTDITTDPILFLLGINLVYLLLGCFIDTTPILLVFVPLLMPTVRALGIDPVHFGVVTVFNLLLGLITPPYGLTMYLVCRMAGLSIIEFWRYAWPILGVMVLVLLLVTLFPSITLLLPNLILPVR
ncbi:MAG: TRAP transporter large permease [Chloroflexi bacterium]|nr:TRAP transporter large permease [Chloroflexota bacterium]